MAYTPNITPGNGTVTDFQVTFPYLRQAHVGVKVNGAVVAKTWVNAGMVRVSPAPSGSVEVYRDTPAVPIATLQDNKPIPAASYNDLVKQAIYFAEEQAYLTAKSTAADRVQTGLDRVAVAADKAAVAADKGTVAADKATVAADKATVASDKSAAATSASNSATSATNSAGSATLASKWASEVEDTPVVAGKFSALHWAAKAAATAATVLNGLAGWIHGATAKTSPADLDEFAMADSAAGFGLKRITWANFKTAMNALYASISHNHAATDINSGTLGDARLPARLGVVAQTITDWNNALDNGWYMGSNVANAPDTSWWLGNVEAHGAGGWRTQTVHGFTTDGSSDTKVYRRAQDSGTWGAWYKLSLSQVEQDARFVRLAADGALSAGYSVTYASDGAKSSGTYTCLPAGSNMRLVQNAGAFTWAADSDATSKAYTIVCILQNTATAGAVTFSGFSKVSGDPLTTVNGALFVCFLVKHGGVKTLTIQAL